MSAKSEIHFPQSLHQGHSLSCESSPSLPLSPSPLPSRPLPSPVRHADVVHAWQQQGVQRVLEPCLVAEDGVGAAQSGAQLRGAHLAVREQQVAKLRGGEVGGSQVHAMAGRKEEWGKGDRQALQGEDKTGWASKHGERGR